MTASQDGFRPSPFSLYVSQVVRNIVVEGCYHEIDLVHVPDLDFADWMCKQFGNPVVAQYGSHLDFRSASMSY